MVPLSTTLALCIPLVSSLIVPFRASPHVFPRAGQLVACDGGADLNLLQTRLYDAVNSENYAAASAMRDRIAELTGKQGGDVDWNRLDLPEWLADWLSRMHFGMATRVQMQALRSLSERDGALWLHRDAVIVSPTGSGKTLAYLLPMLRRFSADLLQEDLTRYLTSSGLVDRTSRPDEVPRPVLMVVVPSRELGVQVSLLAYRLLGGSPSNPTLQPFAHASRYEPGNAANMFTYTGPRRVKVAGLWDEQGLYAAAEQDLFKDAHVLVGTPEFLSRAAVSGKLRLHQLRGLIVDEADAVLTLDSFRALMQQLSDANKAENTPRPQTILAGASIESTHVQLAVDSGWAEAPVIVTPTASVRFGAVGGAEALGKARAADGASGGLPAVVADAASAALREACELSQRVPSGSAHEYIVCEGSDAAIGTCCRLLRKVFTRTDDTAGGNEPAEPADLAVSEGLPEALPQKGTGAEEGAGPPRVVVFTRDAELAVSVASRLQAALWADVEGDATAGLWGLSVLLPSVEKPISSRVDGKDETLSVIESSLRVMEMFRANQTSVLITTAAATRGLDFPQVTHVFNLGIVGSDADYVHRAGRVGRIGQRRKGAVLSVLQPDEVPQLLALGGSLRFTPRRVTAPDPTPLADLAARPGDGSTFSGASGDEERMAADAVARALEDIYSLYDGAEAGEGARGEGKPPTTE